MDCAEVGKHDRWKLRTTQVKKQARSDLLGLEKFKKS